VAEGVERRKRVLTYVTRERDGVRELLVFDDPEHPHIGLQVPAGRADPGESEEECLLRELLEEAGIDQAQIVRKIGMPPLPAEYENHAYEVRIGGGPPADTWEHVVLGDGDDAGLTFHYRWGPVRPDLELFGRRDPLLEELGR
jgi:8-oxo-dGTP pyrophosphatase MutT (NUDIX family)